LPALPAGQYSVTAIKSTYISAAYGQPRPLELGVPIGLGAGASVGGIDFRMVRAGVVAGTITDESGQPLAGTQVLALRYQFSRGARRLVPASEERTNDLGEFRIFSLAPGEYYLAASLHGDADMAKTSEVFVLTYYPGTANIVDARTISIAPGQTLTGIGIRLLAGRPVRISGTLVDSSGMPLKDGRAYTRLQRGFETQTQFATITPDGSFSIAGLAPGDYALRANGQNSAGEPELAAMAIAVGSNDLTNVRLVSAKPTRVSGRVIVNRDELGSLNGSTFNLTVVAASADEAAAIGNGTVAHVNDDFTFVFTVRPGRALVRPTTAGWFLKAVRVNGVDVTDSGIESRTNQPLIGVEVELTRRLPDVTGAVRGPDGALTRNAFVVVFPPDPQRWGYLSRYVSMGRPSPDSEYRIQVPPGEYLAIAVDSIERGEWTDPDFLERVRGRAVPFSLADGEHKTVPLAVVTVTRD